MPRRSRGCVPKRPVADGVESARPATSGSQEAGTQMPRRSPTPCLATLVAATATTILGAQEPAAGPLPWTEKDARAELALSPHDTYLQYVTMQLARRRGSFKAAEELVRSLARTDHAGDDPRRDDLFDLFTDAHAVHESLQLATMRGRHLPSIEQWPKVASLPGPTVRSHPFATMLGERRPDVSRLSCSVPADNYFVEFRSFAQLLDVVDAGDPWSSHLLHQATNQATSHDVGPRLQRQLAVRSDRLLRPLYDDAVAAVAMTGSDLYLREGSDVTLLFELKQPALFRARMNDFLADALASHPDAVRTEGKLLDVDYVHVATDDRTVHVFAADPAPDLHVRSNSRVGLQRVLAAIAGRSADGREVRRLGETDEFRYMRTLMPHGAPMEHGFVYLSVPFLRRIVGPTVKLTEARRLGCYSLLRVIGNAALLHRTERGAAPASLQDLDTHFVPGRFGDATLHCPDGGTYRLTADGQRGVCSRHGCVDALVPCVEIPVAEVDKVEAAAYRRFVAQYDDYWQQFAPPFAVRVHADPMRHRLETVVLPWLDNSVYTWLAESVASEPRSLDAMAGPARSVFRVTGHLAPEAIWRTLVAAIPSVNTEQIGSDRAGVDDAVLWDFVRHVLTGHVALHVCDSVPTFDLSLPEFLGENVNWSADLLFGSWLARAVPLVVSLNAPVHACLGVRDEAAADSFLARIDAWMAKVARRPRIREWFDLRFDFAVVTDRNGRTVRSASYEWGPIRWRVHWTRIGSVLHVTTRRETLDDLAAPPPGPAVTGHVMLQMRPENWVTVRESFQLGWADNVRRACLDNLGTLAAVGRALHTMPEGQARDARMAELARSLHGVHLRCPEAGAYHLRTAPDGCTVECAVHGTLRAPRQPATLLPNGALGKLLDGFGGLRATLTFLPEGLRAVLEIDRRE